MRLDDIKAGRVYRVTLRDGETKIIHEGLVEAVRRIGHEVEVDFENAFAAYYDDDDVTVEEV